MSDGWDDRRIRQLAKRERIHVQLMVELTVAFVTGDSAK
jgi:hypothetical protein